MNHVNKRLFKLKIRQSKSSTNIDLRLQVTTHHTADLPLTEQILSQHLPSIYLHRCFNQKNRSFKEESKQTPFGHLFEHILLEYLCKLQSNKEDYKVRGVTTWDWDNEEEGLFHINIDSGRSDTPVFKNALEKTIDLSQKILLGTLQP